jgi:hypothetical protein
MTRSAKFCINNGVIHEWKITPLSDSFGKLTPLLAIPSPEVCLKRTSRHPRLAELTVKPDSTWNGTIAVLRETRAALRLQNAEEGQTQ